MSTVISLTGTIQEVRLIISRGYLVRYEIKYTVNGSDKVYTHWHRAGLKDAPHSCQWNFDEVKHLLQNFDGYFLSTNTERSKTIYKNRGGNQLRFGVRFFPKHHTLHLHPIH